jgi:uncharacterized protein (DUF433 family)
MDWRKHIAIDPSVCHGRACVAGTRVTVASVLDNLADGLSPEEILVSYPSLRRDDIRAVMGYAAALASDRVIPLEEAG